MTPSQNCFEMSSLDEKKLKKKKKRMNIDKGR